MTKNPEYRYVRLTVLQWQSTREIAKYYPLTMVYKHVTADAGCLFEVRCLLKRVNPPISISTAFITTSFEIILRTAIPSELGVDMKSQVDALTDFRVAGYHNLENKTVPVNDIAEPWWQTIPSMFHTSRA